MTGRRIFHAVNAVILTCVVIVTLYPFLNIVARSFSSEEEIIAGRVNLLPRGFDLTTYRLVMSDDLFWTNYRNTVVYTVVATIISIVLTPVTRMCCPSGTCAGAACWSGSRSSPCSSPAA